MDYNQLLQEIKNIFLPKLKAIVHQAAYDANPKLTKDLYLDMLYTDIMALGYNFNDAKKATDDIYEMQSILHGESDEFYKYIQERVLETQTIYPFFVNIFSMFHSQWQAQVNPNQIIENVKSEFEAI